MRITPNSGLAGGQPADSIERAGTPNSTQEAKPNRSANPAETDEARLSPDAVQLSNLKSALASVPPVRQERVNALKQAIQSGSYTVSNRQIAHSMMQDFRAE